MSPVPNSAEFQLRPSFYYLSARLVLVIIASALIAALPLLIWVKIMGLLSLGLAARWLIVDYLGQSPETLIMLDASEDRWRLVSVLKALEAVETLETVELVLAPTQFATRYLVILYFKLPQGRQIVRVLPRDALSAPQHRLLRMVLIGRAFGS
ncbi:L-aspartate oxidase [gamma proteobacterium HTCC2207]|uniref:L-aspartate oxidase n=1 Tax=gamma proteobacterium HTCC2207 TaxID=314287 RepID=Q1YS40_9GAMM|nr:L-aspartate oxidase [gamma proteobacterium HTCC2207]